MLAILGGQVITMAGPPLPMATILIDKGKIKAIGRRVDVPPEAEVVSAVGKVIMPGLVEAHCHLGLLEEIYRIEGDDVNETSDPITPHLRALDGINPNDIGFQDALKGGVTTVFVTPGSANPLGGQGVVLKTHGQVIDHMVLREPAGLKMAMGENPKRVYGQQKKAPTTRMATAGLIRENFVKAQNYLKKIQEAKTDASKAPDRDLKLEAIGMALNGYMPVRVHAHRADDILTALRLGAEFGLDMVIEHCTEGHQVAEILAQRRIPAVVGPTLSNRSKVELKDMNWQTASVLHQAGVEIALMTDHPVVPIQYLLLCASLVARAGLREERALAAVTRVPARILGVEDRVGTLEVGKDADLIILDGPPLAWDTQIERVFVNGRTAYQRENTQVNI